MNPQKQSQIDALLQRGYRLRVMDSLQDGWQIVSQHLGSFVGFTLLTFLMVIASICLLFLPLLFAGNLIAGYYAVSMRIKKGQSITFSDFFDGFRNSNFAQILLANLVISLMTSLAYIPMYGLQTFLSVDPNLINDPKILAGFSLLALIGVCGAIYITILYLFTIPLILDHRLDFWPAMELSRKITQSQWPSYLGLYSLLSLLGFVGILTCGLGTLVTSPLWFAAIIAAYDQVVGLEGKPEIAI